jgi:hypothetical protein
MLSVAQCPLWGSSEWGFKARSVLVVVDTRTESFQIRIEGTKGCVAVLQSPLFQVEIFASSYNRVSRYGVETFCQIPLSMFEKAFKIKGKIWIRWTPISHPK